MGKILVVTAAATAALAVPATAAFADHGHHGGGRHGHGHHLPWFRPASCPSPTAGPAVTVRRPAPPPRTRRAPAPVRVVAVVQSRPPAVTPSASAPPTLVVGTPAAAAMAPVSWAGMLPVVAGAAVVVTLISLGFSVRRGLARVG